jgi:5'-nucleotidase
MAHEVAGIAIIESFSRGVAFGRVDLTVGAAVTRRIHPPQRLCPAEPPAPCAPGDYEGAPVVASAKIAALIEPAYARARAKRDESLGVTLDAKVSRAHKEESALGSDHRRHAPGAPCRRRHH